MMNCTTYTNSCTVASAIKANNEAFHKRLERLYPCVDDVTKLPQTWSPDSKAPPLGLSYDNLGCYFRGNGRRDDDDKFAAAARTDNFIPPSCLLYYFEIKIISKGLEGCTGIGLTSPQFQLTKMPGWARESYGYHADDGKAHSGDGRDHQYGPSFTTHDVIGCGYNLVEGKSFFTKNGLNLGTAFKDLPSNILFYPTIGLRKPSEEIKANFGQEDFVYDIEQDLRELRRKMTLTIADYPINDFTDWQSTLHKLIQSWLLQNSYPQTAEAFTKATKIECKENIQRAQQRNRIQQLVLNGKISEAIRLTNRLCPNLFQNNPNLLFALKCRQFVELISGAESDYQPIFNYADLSTSTNTHNNNINTSNSSNGVEHRIDTNGDQPDSLDHHLSRNNNNNNNGCNGMIGNNNNNTDNSRTNGDKIAHNQQQSSSSSSSLQELMDVDQPLTTSSSNTMDTNHRNNNSAPQTLPPPPQIPSSQTTTTTLGNNNLNQQNISKSDTNGNTNQTHLANSDAGLDQDEEKFVRLLQFGRELSNYLQQLDHIYGKNETNEKMLQDTISLIAFTNPKTSSLGKLLDPSEREPVSQLLNSSIVKAEMGYSYRPPLEEVMNHLRKLVRLNDSYGRWIVDRLY